MTETEELSAPRAAEWLAQRQPTRTIAAWTQWLANNRNPRRAAAFRVPHTKKAGHVWYRLADLQAILSTEHAIQSGHVPKGANLLRVAEVMDAFGIGQGGTNTGYVWQDATVVEAFDEVTSAPFVQLKISNPRLTVYRLELAQAAKLANDLANACKEAQATAAHRASLK